MRFEIQGSRFEGSDRVVETGAAPGWAGVRLLGAAAALGGERGEQGDADTVELRDASVERFAQSGEGSGEFVGKGLRGGAEGEGDLEAG